MNHVKENDLLHGEFIKWLNKIGIERTEAHRFMTVAKEIPNVDTWQQIGNRALYLIATLPEEEREKEHEGEVKISNRLNDLLIHTGKS